MPASQIEDSWNLDVDCKWISLWDGNGDVKDDDDVNNDDYDANYDDDDTNDGDSRRESWEMTQLDFWSSRNGKCFRVTFIFHIIIIIKSGESWWWWYVFILHITIIIKSGQSWWWWYVFRQASGVSQTWTNAWCLFDQGGGWCLFRLQVLIKDKNNDNDLIRL